MVSPFSITPLLYSSFKIEDYISLCLIFRCLVRIGGLLALAVSNRVTEKDGLCLRYYETPLHRDECPLGVEGPFPPKYVLNSEQERQYPKTVKDKGVFGTVWFGPKSQGPYGLAHGGAMAAVLDEVGVNEFSVLCASFVFGIVDRWTDMWLISVGQ